VDTVQNLKAFLAVAHTGSFSAAARRTGLATSVVAKRIDQLEAAIRTKLFVRSTRRLVLTDAGRGWLDRVRPVVSDVDDLIDAAARPRDALAGRLRIKAPTTLAVLYLADILASFQMRHPKIALDIVLTDRALNPAEEGFDVAISAFGTTYGGVIDVPLCPVQRTVCAAPAYLAARGVPCHPRDLFEHDTLNFQPTGDIWMFDSAHGPVSIEIHPRLSANDGQVVLAAARAGNGIALLSDYVAAAALQCGELVPVLQPFTVPEIWMKALVPASRLHVARVGALVDALKAALSPPPWDVAGDVCAGDGIEAEEGQAGEDRQDADS
jgi:DNA-binding transcriptional LysR family regulator